MLVAQVVREIYASKAVFNMHHMHHQLMVLPDCLFFILFFYLLCLFFCCFLFYFFLFVFVLFYSCVLNVINILVKKKKYLIE